MSTPRARARRPSTEGALALHLFTRLVPEPSWAPWRVLVKSIFGLPLTADELSIFQRLTGRTKPLVKRVREFWGICGRRGGKSRAMSAIAVWAACIPKYRLAPGEHGVVMLLAADRRQAGILKSYIAAMIRSIAELDAMLVTDNRESIELSNGIVIEVHTSSFRTIRGRTVVCAIEDELPFWPTDESSAEPDKEVLTALRPSLATTGGLLLCVSSPYGQRGALHAAFRDHFGRDDDADVLVVQAESRFLNATIPQAVVDQALADDAAAAGAEWLAQFRTDLESLLSREALDAVVVRGRFELAQQAGAGYAGFIDPSGGSSDSMTLGIAHRDAVGMPVLDLVLEIKPPFSPEDVVAEFAGVLKRYGLTKVTGDRYGGEWVSSSFDKAGIAYEASELTSSELYLELVPMVNSGSVELLDNPRLISQLGALERRVGRSGKDSIDHRPGAHDDLANAAAGALVYAVRSVGLKAPYPADFTSCRVWGLVSWAPNCFLLGGGVVSEDPACQDCPGFKVALAAFNDYRSRTPPEEWKTLPVYARGRFSENRFTSRHKFDRAIEVLGL